MVHATAAPVSSSGIVQNGPRQAMYSRAGMIEALKLATICAEPGALNASPGSGRKPSFCAQFVHEIDQKLPKTGTKVQV
jgi:hypothetical protein